MAKTKKPKVVILAGGMGMRMREETEYRPKPMVLVGSHPILWHIMKSYMYYGFNDFVICLGYKGEMIKEYFLNYEAFNNDLTITFGKKCSTLIHKKNTFDEFYGNSCRHGTGNNDRRPRIRSGKIYRLG